MAKMRINISVEETIKREFHSVCALLGVSGSSIIEQQMEKFTATYKRLTAEKDESKTDTDGEES
jgi:antitoxin component of RelBE/YafQ-DinJ toxin-antitoxin module|tara:strand:+ start:95 stop:286 length:192 start_codon:yes stop_codon:yes gene_type:complete